MNKEVIVATLEQISLEAGHPLHRPLEVGFRHNPLTAKEVIDRYQETLDGIKVSADALLELIEEAGVDV